MKKSAVFNWWVCLIVIAIECLLSLISGELTVMWLIIVLYYIVAWIYISFPGFLKYMEIKKPS